jgi:hypothetical protein
MSKYVLRLEVEAIKELSNYAHWIPMVRGYTRDYMDSHYPDWEWNDLIPKMLSRGIISTEQSDGDTKLWQGLWLKAGVSAVVVTKTGNRASFRCEQELSVDLSRVEE